MKSLLSIRSMATMLIAAAASMGNAAVPTSRRDDPKREPKYRPRAYRLREGRALEVNTTDSRQVRRWKTRMQHKGAAIASESVQRRFTAQKSAVLEKIDDARKHKATARNQRDYQGITGCSGAKLWRKAEEHKLGYAGLR